LCPHAVDEAWINGRHAAENTGQARIDGGEWPCRQHRHLGELRPAGVDFEIPVRLVVGSFQILAASIIPRFSSPDKPRHPAAGACRDGRDRPRLRMAAMTKPALRSIPSAQLRSGSPVRRIIGIACSTK